MNKMLVAVFESETKAYEGLSALKELHDEGSISVYATCVLAKDKEGKVEIKEASEQGPKGFSTGLFAGALLGILGGPLGVAIGAGIGSLTGAIYDMNKSGLDISFLEEIAHAIVPGKVALVADLVEAWTVPIDTRLEALDGQIFRRNRAEVIEDQMARETAALQAEWEELNEEMKEAGEDMKASLQQEIDKIQNKMHSIKESAEQSLKSAKEEFEAKAEALKEQIQKASEKGKAKLEKRISELESTFASRKAKLQEVVSKMAPS
ncbi:MAG: DUF1269 domain-containing protein [Bacteroidota bacterium]